MLPRDRLPRQAKGFDGAGPLARSQPHAPSRAHPLQAWNPHQAKAELEGVGAGARESLARAAGGAGGTWSLMRPGPKGGRATIVYIHAINRGPSKCVARRGLCSAVNRWFSGLLSRPAGGGIHYNQANTCARFRLVT